MAETTQTRVALITGGSRGIGAATTLALAEHGYDVVLTYRNKAARADDVVSQATQRGVRALAVGCDITLPGDRERLFHTLHGWSAHLDLLVLNASGGMEREALANDPDYPMHINRDAQIALLDHALPLLPRGGVVVFVTSHWAHLYGQVAQIPAYAPVAESKHAGELALRARQQELTALGIRLIIVTGDLVAGTITPKLLERAAPGLAGQRHTSSGTLPSTTDMGEAIVHAATNVALPSGHVVVVGGSLASLLHS